MLYDYKSSCEVKPEQAQVGESYALVFAQFAPDPLPRPSKW
jgi:hypothetical protein